ncbi:SAM-dependent methyltransferase [Rhizobium leguminosarum]|uniref:Cyclopropane-fatty-acyl-phospholipid synthase n=1 Tax=Rhizobium leguminosarum TaxID=384 RepID=A0A7W9ZQL0_RHILE|nr:cyclopropane-fatty-acyl-phospholipid synthase family protein [Rhizobium leguminosarum]MBB6219877.1 cyclopropane-fatty-acyl-phospholipid synthase [Rhizobium leguminosarum]
MAQFDRAASPPAAGPAGRSRVGIGGLVFRRLIKDLRHGQLTVVLPNGEAVTKRGTEDGPDATIVLRRWGALRKLVMSGDLGAAEGYIDGDWITPNLTAVIRLAVTNADVLATALSGTRIARTLGRIRHILNANTRQGSRRNIEAHYDLGNEFYKQWLDGSMLYSSALFEDATQTLEAAQQNRIRRIRKKLGVVDGHRVLEVGCGWGVLALELASYSNAHLVGLTLSPSQLEWAQGLVAAAGKASQVELRIQDYRDVDGKFDRIVSIEMFEAVGEAYWPDYFAMIKRCMTSGGRTLLQVISIEERRFDDYRSGIDFIQRYIFPGGFLPSDEALRGAVERAGLKLTEVEHFGKSYARTLRDWRTRFVANWPAIASLGFDETFKRLWNYYLCYCEAGFEEESINVGLYTIEHA